jgi:hypothetical protein
MPLSAPPNHAAVGAVARPCRCPGAVARPCRCRVAQPCCCVRLTAAYGTPSLCGGRTCVGQPARPFMRPRTYSGRRGDSTEATMGARTQPAAERGWKTEGIWRSSSSLARVWRMLRCRRAHPGWTHKRPPRLRPAQGRDPAEGSRWELGHRRRRTGEAPDRRQSGLGLECVGGPTTLAERLCRRPVSQRGLVRCWPAFASRRRGLTEKPQRRTQRLRRMRGRSACRDHCGQSRSSSACRRKEVPRPLASRPKSRGRRAESFSRAPARGR